MFTNTELNIMELLLSDLTTDYSIRDISHELRQNYSIIHSTIKRMGQKGYIKLRRAGNTILCKANINQYNFIYLVAEEKIKQRAINRSKIIKGIDRESKNLGTAQYTLILFGSYAENKEKKKSDIDLLLILPEYADAEQFEKQFKTALILYEDKLDINIVAEKSMFEMWSKPNELNVANEILKNHILLNGAESYYKLLAKK